MSKDAIALAADCFAATARGIFPGTKTHMEGASAAGPLDAEMVVGVVNLVVVVGACTGDMTAVTDGESALINEEALYPTLVKVGWLAIPTP